MARKRNIRGVRDRIPGGYVLGRLPGKGQGAVTIIPFTPNASGGVGGGSGGGAGVTSIAIEIFVGSTMRGSEVIGQIIAPVEFSLPINLAGSFAKSVIASTGVLVLSIRKATAAGGTGAEIGTVTFTASAVGVFAFAAQVDFVEGDRLLVICQATPDPTLSDTTILLLGTV